MSTKATTTYTMKCDGCSKKYADKYEQYYEYDNEGDLVLDAAHSGWHRDSDHDYCPDCWEEDEE